MIKDRIKFNVGTKSKNTNPVALTIRDQRIRAEFISKVTRNGSISRIERKVK